MGKDKGDGLRMFVVDELGELLWIGLLQGVEAGGLRAQRFYQPVDHSLGVFGAEGIHKELWLLASSQKAEDPDEELLFVASTFENGRPVTQCGEGRPVFTTMSISSSDVSTIL